MKPVVRWILLAALALLAAACARLAYMNASLAYSQATPLIAWTVDGYVDLTHEQRDWLHARLDRAMAWHRARELPEYSRFLASVADRSDRAFTDEEVAKAWADVREDYRRVVERILPDAADFLLTLDERQLANMQRRFDQDNRKFVKESTRGTPAERQAQAAKRAAGHLEEWVGDLQPSQRAIVAAWAQALPPLVEERLADRRYRQSETIALARTRDRERIIAGLHRLLLETDAWRRPERREKFAARERATLHMIAVLSATLTPAQRAHLKGRIRGYMQDITRFASSG
ncbi:MAG TPA: DUF6279 family lipoprotein [Usitatibacter sp.]|nr:DUF6279 family lipoprotein [Usitatibacter sp.]